MPLLEISLNPLWQAILYVCLTGENLWRIWCLCDLVQRFLNTRNLALRYVKIKVVTRFYANEGKIGTGPSVLDILSLKFFYTLKGGNNDRIQEIW